MRLRIVSKSIAPILGALTFGCHAIAADETISRDLRTRGYYEEIYWDKTFAPESSASVISYPYHYISRALDSHTTKLAGGSSVEGQLRRFLHFSLLEVPIIAFSATLQHEMSHGFRMREAGCEPTYQFGLPPPYFLLNKGQRHLGATAYDDNCYAGSTDQQIFAMGGHEGNAVFSDYLRRTSFSNHSFSRSLSNLYVVNRLELIIYNDREQGSNQNIEGVRQQRNVRSKALLNLADPLLLVALLQNAEFVRSGQIADMEDVFNYSPVYPFLSYRLIPFGESFGAGAVTNLADHLWELNISKWNFYTYLADHGKNDGYHVSFSGESFLKSVASSGFGYRMSLEAAREPFFMTGSWDEYSWVYGCDALVRFQPSPSGIGYLAGVGVKNRGFLPGKYIKAGSGAMIGFVLNNI